MKPVVLIAMLAIGLFSAAANAEKLFKDCEDISADSSYLLLQKYISTMDEGNIFCQRLSDSEYLYTTSNNIYYCTSNDGARLRCVANERGTWLPDLKLLRRFSADRGKQFVLLTSTQVSREQYRQSYLVFYLSPKTVDPRGYAWFRFPDAGAFDANHGSGMCESGKDNEAVSPLSPGFEIINENKNNVGIRFNQQKIICKTGEKMRQTLEYTWQLDHFQQTKNLLQKMPAGR